jgi:hypothetical protein
MPNRPGRGWAYGLGKLLDSLKRQKVPVEAGKVQINPNLGDSSPARRIPIKNEPGRAGS